MTWTNDREGWAVLGVKLDGEVLGAPAYHPRALLSGWVYGFIIGVRSCRRLARLPQTLSRHPIGQDSDEQAGPGQDEWRTPTR